MSILDWKTNRRNTTQASPKRKRRGLKKQPKTVREPLGQKRARPAAPTKLRKRNDVETMPDTVRERKMRNLLAPFKNKAIDFRVIVSSVRWLSFGIFCLCVYALYLIGTNQRFYLSNIKIAGASVIDSAEILRVSGLEGAHIFAIEPDVAAEAINTIPGVLSAQVELRWPDDMEIIVDEDTPIITWNEGGQEYWVNAEGALVPAFGQSFDLMKIIAEVPAPIVPVPVEIEIDKELDGSAVPAPITFYQFVPHEVMDGAVELQGLIPDLVMLTYKPSGGLHYQDPRGWTAKFGTGEMRVKHATYEAMAAMLNERGIVPEYIDVSIAAKPVYKPAFEVSNQ